jgi:hypothetical protein
LFPLAEEQSITFVGEASKALQITFFRNGDNNKSNPCQQLGIFWRSDWSRHRILNYLAAARDRNPVVGERELSTVEIRVSETPVELMGHPNNTLTIL